MIARGRELEERRGPSGTVLIPGRAGRLDKSLMLQLQKLLPDRFGRQLQGAGELRDGGPAAALQLRENRTPAFGQLGERNGRSFR